MEDTFENKFDDYYKKVRSTIEKVLMVILLKIHRDSDKIIRDNKAVATAELVKNLREQVYESAGQIIGVVGIGANVPYGIYEHEGTKPHFPPIEPLVKWVIKKGIIRDDKGRTTTMRRAKKEGDDVKARAIAFLIARKISKSGTKGLPFLKMALMMNTDFIIKNLKLQS